MIYITHYSDFETYTCFKERLQEMGYRDSEGPHGNFLMVIPERKVFERVPFVFACEFINGPQGHNYKLVPFNELIEKISPARGL